jgi:acyl-CoA synthetase (AMP-forming)/AMP-acid ligase II
MVALTADLLGRSEHDLGAALRFARVVPSMPDRFVADPGDPPAEAFTVAAGSPPAPAGGVGEAAGEGMTMAGLLAEAARLVARTGLGDRDRLLCGLGLLRPAGVAAGLLAPFGTGAGVVLAREFQPAGFWKRVADERVTVAVLDAAQAEALQAAGPPPAGLDHSRLRAIARVPADG